jgi:O-methyltransferase involved in polyketide biosynthesis
LRTLVTAAACALAALTLFGPAIARADAAQEQEACQLMDDPTAHDLGYAPAEYAFMVLRGKMSAEAARNVMSIAAQEYCPNHITDLPASWR